MGWRGGGNLSFIEETRFGGRIECGERRFVLVFSLGDRGVSFRCVGNIVIRVGVEERGGVYLGVFGGL